MEHKQRQERLLRLSEVLKRVPVSKAHWWAGVASGVYPQSVRLGKKVTCWRESDIAALVEKEG